MTQRITLSMRDFVFDEINENKPENMTVSEFVESLIVKGLKEKGGENNEEHSDI